MDHYRVVRNEVESRLNSALANQSYSEVLEEIGIISMILATSFSKRRKERRLVKHAEKTADYRLFIDFEAFANGSERDRKRLLVENLLASVEDIHRKLRGAFDGARLRKDILRLFPEVVDER